MHIWDLFTGYEKAHGRYEVKRVNEKGKNEGRAITLKEPVTVAMWESHLKGSGAGIGIIPLKADNTVSWGVIDIDVIGIDLNKLEAQCRKLELPLVICRSKSGGAHAFLFLAQDTDARTVIEALASWAAALGQGGCEVFPKQYQRYDEENDIGNWLNMPYFYAERTNRYCWHDGQQLTLEQFVEFASSMRVTEDQLEIRARPVSSGGQSLNEGLFEEGPPCLQILHSNGGFPDGTRNDGMYNVAVYLRKRFPDDYVEKLQEYNVAMCDPPLTLAEINTIAKSIGKKEYEYRCKKPPIASYCNRRICLGRKCGVGETAHGVARPEILDIKKYIGDPTIWYMTINGQRMMFTTEELVTQAKFNTRIFDALNILPRTVPPDRWSRFLTELVAGCEIEHAPLDATPFDQFKIVLEGYLNGKSKTTSKDQLLTSYSPFIVGDGTILFKFRGLLKYLDNNGYRYKSEHHIAQMLKSDDVGAYPKTMSIKGKTTNLWIVRQPDQVEDDDPEINFGTKEF